MRWVVALTATAITMALSGCGDQSVTLNYQTEGLTYYIVSSGTAEAISSEKTRFAQGVVDVDISPSEAQLLDGDQHQGSQLCAFDKTIQGQSYHIVVYSPTPAMTLRMCTDKSYQ
jgi:hypothetical protein